MTESLAVERTHHVDDGERGPDGLLDYRYSYWAYVFRGDSAQLSARRYDDTPGIAAIVACRLSEQGPWTGFPEIPYDDAVFCDAVRHLLEQEGVSKVEILLHGTYTSVDLARVRPSRRLLFGLEDTSLRDYRSEAERTFLESLHARSVTGGWHGLAWIQLPQTVVTVSAIDPSTKGAVDLRVDFFGSRVVVGRDETHQFVGELDLSRPDVLSLDDRPVPELAAFAADWIESQIKRIKGSAAR